MKDLRDWIDVIFKVVLALTGIVVGYFFSFQKQQNDDIKLIVEMATASESAKRIMGASIAKAYFDQGRIPEAVYVAVFSYANNSDDEKLRAVVNSGAAASVQAEPSLQQALTKATNALPIRIYFHIRQETDRQAAEAIESAIQSSRIPGGIPIIVPGIQLVSGTQSNSQLRCFKKEECQMLGPQLVKLFQENNVPMELSDLSAKYEQSTTIRPNHFEAWFAPTLRQ
jgi:hypothetical protein